MKTIEMLMTPSPHSIGPEQTVARALRRMRELGIRHLPVLEGGKLVGMVSERELELLASFPANDPERCSVEQAMQPEPYIVEEGTGVKAVAAGMAERKVGSAVVTKSGKLSGVFTTVDALRALAAAEPN